MFTFLLILLILDALVLIPVVLLQAGKGGGLAAMGGGGAGTDTLFGGRHATTLLTRLSWWTGGLFIALAFALSLMAPGVGGGGSLLQEELQRGQPVVPAAPLPGTGGTQVPPVQGAAPATGAQPAAPTEAPAAEAPAPAGDGQ